MYNPGLGQGDLLDPLVAREQERMIAEAQAEAARDAGSRLEQLGRLARDTDSYSDDYTNRAILHPDWSNPLVADESDIAPVRGRRLSYRSIEPSISDYPKGIGGAAADAWLSDY